MEKMFRTVKIGNKLIGNTSPCFIIAEAGVNHNGNISLAKKLIDAAKDADVDAVKFQTFFTENLVTKTAPKAKYQKITTGAAGTQYEMLKNLELRKEEFIELKEYAEKAKIIFLSTPYGKESSDFLEQIGVSGFKISSAEITNIPLVTHIAKKALPMIVSTGMSTLGEVGEAVSVIKASKNNEIILLHCNFNYPAEIGEINLRAMETLRKAFGLPVGYSDHTLGVEVLVAAVALGACVIEKHFTLDRNLPGPDHRVSLEPDELEIMVKSIRNVEKALGSFIKQPSKSEAPNRKISRRSLVANRDISKGVRITKGMINIKRPGTGIMPKHYNAVIGLEALKGVGKDEVLTWNIFTKKGQKR